LAPKSAATRGERQPNDNRRNGVESDIDDPAQMRLDALADHLEPNPFPPSAGKNLIAERVRILGFRRRQV